MPEYELPDEITITLAEVSKVLLSLYDARDTLSEVLTDESGERDLLEELEASIRLVQRKLVPDFPE